MSERILVNLSWARSVPASPQAVQMMLDKGWEVVYNDRGRNLTPDEVTAEIVGVSACIAGSERYTPEAFAAADKLKAICRVGVGYDAVNTQAATAKGVVVTTSPVKGLFEAMADHTFGLMIASSRRIVQANANVKAGKWQRMMGYHLFHQTLGIIGLGRIGREVARIAAAFQMKILCYDVVRDEQFAAELGMQYVDLPELLAQADYVTLHTPLNDATRGMMNRERLSLMKPTAILINTARGPVVDEEALAWALQEKVIAAAASDVFAKEPPPADNPLLKMDNFIATPHVAGLSLQAVDQMFTSAVQSAIDVIEGRKPYLVVNPDVYEGK